MHDTVDFRNKMFKALYKEIFAVGRQDDLLRELERVDAKHDGKVSPRDL